ncbi:MAG: hypothetical protein ABJB66_08160 [Gemmatimonadaceae bacterium]
MLQPKFHITSRATSRVVFSLRNTMALIALALTVASCTHNTGTSGGGASGNSLTSITEGFDPQVQRDIEALRSATNPYHDLKAAQAAGYPTTTPSCVADSTMGGMGRHYMNRPVYDNNTVDIAHPEMLIYASVPKGTPERLVGVEYAIPFRLLPSTEKAPRLFGQEFKRHEEFKYWYLHVWAWQKNKAGLFSDWNPAIKC